MGVEWGHEIRVKIQVRDSVARHAFSTDPERATSLVDCSQQCGLFRRAYLYNDLVDSSKSTAHRWHRKGVNFKVVLTRLADIE
jgi:hypothetical protein